jgi:hypothetical protein
MRFMVTERGKSVWRRKVSRRSGTTSGTPGLVPTFRTARGPQAPQIPHTESRRDWSLRMQSFFMPCVRSLHRGAPRPLRRAPRLRADRRSRSTRGRVGRCRRGTPSRQRSLLGSCHSRPPLVMPRTRGQRHRNERSRTLSEIRACACSSTPFLEQRRLAFLYPSSRISSRHASCRAGCSALLKNCMSSLATASDWE